MDGSASGFATKLQQNFLAWLEAGLVVPVTARGRDVLARVNIPSSPAICSNGGCILDDEGSLDLVWHMQLQVASRHSEPVLDVHQDMTGNLSAERFRHWSVDENSLGLYIVNKSNERNEQELAQRETGRAQTLPEGRRCHPTGQVGRHQT